LEVQNIYTFQAPGIAKKILKDIKNEAYIQKISYHFHTCGDFKKMHGINLILFKICILK
ncbi:lipase, partial [Campylobacter coli]|nr:lipase [Campylobacter coli]